MRAKPDYFLLFCRLFVGVLFTLSGLIKVNDVRGFAYKLEEYFEVFYKHSGIPFHEIFGPWSVGIAGAIAIFETGLAFFLLIGYARHFTAWSLFLMILFFTFLTAYSAITRAVSDCGCFGEVVKLTPWQSFGKDVILLLLIGYIFHKREEIMPWLPKRVSAPIAWFLLGAIGALTLYFYLYLPVIDFLPYREGTHLKAALEPGPQGVPQITDYVSTQYTDCQIDELQGNTLVVVAIRLEALGDKEVEKLRNLLRGLPPDVKVVGITSSPESIRKRWPQEKGLSICFAPQDQTVMKAILRSSAGALYMENGVIRKKWAWRQLPSGAELMKWRGSS
ncbi:MAG: DoxX family protein [Bacteroidia bacterium]|nr:DoxX family protein [Bacteroidia bacterium]MDW8134075.1 DoxX family protein [Bacteroidia bacterium]